MQFGRRLAYTILIGALTGQVLVLGYELLISLGTPFGQADLRLFAAPALMIQYGQSRVIYDLPNLAAAQATLGIEQVVPFAYFPAFLALIYPLTLLPSGYATLAWTILNVVLIGLSLKMLSNALVPAGDRFLFVLLAASFLPLSVALRLGQSTFILLLGLTLASIGLLRGKDLWTGLGLAALLIKPQLLPLWILLLLWQRRLRALAYLTLAALLVAALSWLMVGTEGMIGYLRLLTNGTMNNQYAWSHTLLGLARSVGGDYTVHLAIGSSGVVLAILSACAWLVRFRSTANQRVLLTTVLLSAMLLAGYLLFYDLSLGIVGLALVWPLATVGRGRYFTTAAVLSPWIAHTVSQLGSPFVWPTVITSAVAFFALVWCAISRRNSGSVFAGNRMMAEVTVGLPNDSGTGPAATPSSRIGSRLPTIRLFPRRSDGKTPASIYEPRQ